MSSPRQCPDNVLAMARSRQAAVIAGCLALSIAGFACGSDRSNTTQTTAATSTTGTSTTAIDRPARLTNIVSSADIEKTASRTPERTILRWAQAVQFGDVNGVRLAFSRRIRAAIPSSRLAAATREVGALLGKPVIVSRRVRGDLALVEVELVSYGSDGKRSTQPTTMRLRREDGRWMLDDERLLLDTAAALRQPVRR